MAIKNDRYQIIILAIVVIFILLVIFALIFRNVDIGNKNKSTVGTVVSDGDLSINYVDGDKVVVKDGKEHSYAVSITNTGSNKLFYSLYLTDLNSNEAFVSVEDYEGNVLKSLEEDLDYKRLINLQEIKAGETARYVVKVDGTKKDNFKARLIVVNESLTSDNFADLLLSTYEVKMPITRVGSEISGINEGLIESLDNKGKTYYFRGNVNYNYVKLGNLLFRIVRINGDGSIRLVLNDVLAEQYPYNTNEPQEEITYADLSNLKNASITATLNQWYNNNLGEYKKYVVDSDFCTDDKFNVNTGSIFYSNTYDRIFVDDTPDLYCSGTIYTGKVGLLSADEIALAGAYRGVANNKYYLYNENIKGNYVTNSTYSISENDVHMINVMSNGAFGNSIVASEKTNIRPVISIGLKAKVKGEGTIENPYIIVA